MGAGMKKMGGTWDRGEWLGGGLRTGLAGLGGGVRAETGRGSRLDLARQVEWS